MAAEVLAAVAVWQHLTSVAIAAASALEPATQKRLWGFCFNHEAARRLSYHTTLSLSVVQLLRAQCPDATSALQPAASLSALLVASLDADTGVNGNLTVPLTCLKQRLDSARFAKSVCGQLAGC